jgi:hypothetical protein
MFATTVLGYTLTGIWLVFWTALAIFLWLFIAFWPASIASKKGHSFWLFFILSLFFWWITFFVAIFMKDQSTSEASPAPIDSSNQPS